MTKKGDDKNNGAPLAEGLPGNPLPGIEWTSLLDASRHAMFLVDHHFFICYLNEPAKKILPDHSFGGASGPALFTELLPADRKDKALSALKQVLEGNEMIYETEHTTTGQAPVWYEMHYRPMVNADGLVQHILISASDITGYKKNEIALRRTEQRWKVIVEGDGNGVWEIDFARRETYYSPFYKSMLGFSEQEFDELVPDLKARVHADDLQKVANIQALYEKMVIRQHSVEYRVRKKDDEYAWMLDRGMVIESGPDHRPLRITGTMKDITNLKLAEEALRQSEDRYYQMVDSIEDYAIMMLDPSGNVLNWNKGAEKIKGYRAWEIIGKSFYIFYPKKDVLAGLPQSLLEKALNQGRAFSEGWRVKKDGTQFWASVTITQVRDREGNLQGYSKITRDLTDNKLAADKLVKSEFQFSSFMDNTPTLNWVIDEHAVFRYLNRSYMKAFNLHVGHIGKSIYEIFPPHICDEFVANNWKVWNTGKAIQTYEEGIGPAGDKQYYLTYKFPLPDEQGVRLLGGVSLDLTQQRILESELANEEDKRKREVIVAIIEAQEKERKSIAYQLHDNVNQILTSSRLMLEVAAEKPDSYNKFVNDSLVYLQDAIQEVRRISHSLTPGTLSDIGLEDAIEEVVTDINHSGQLLIQYKKRILGTTQAVPADIQLTLLRIVQEQLRNVIKHAGAETATVILKCTPQRISVRIEDDGNGFDVMAVKKGLGLNGIYNRTESFNGKVFIESTPGNGCTLIVQIPLFQI